MLRTGNGNGEKSPPKITEQKNINYWRETMKKIALCLMLSMAVSLHIKTVHASEQNQSLAPLQAFEGKYFNDKVNLHAFLETAGLDIRLKKLVGKDRYDQLIWVFSADRTLSGPLKKQDNVLFTEVMNFYGGDPYHFKIFIDLNKDKIAVCLDMNIWFQEGLPPKSVDCYDIDFYFSQGFSEGN
jgi:hypothetical protein